MGDEDRQAAGRSHRKLSDVISNINDVNYPDPGFCSKTSLIQLGCGIWINLSSVSVGLIYGFTAVAIPQMTHPDVFMYNNITIAITEQEEGWMTSLTVLVAPIGTLICGYILDHFGRQVGNVLSVIPLIIGWLFLSLATDISLLLIGRVINGIGIGMVKLIPTIYTSEITLPNMRGVTGVIPQLAQSIGITIQASLGMKLHWHHISYMCLSYNLLLIVANSLVPETPYYKLMKGTEAEALESLKQFRSNKYDVDLEIKDLIQFKINNDIRRLSFRGKCKAVCSRVVCKPLLIVLTYILIAELSGVSIIYFYGVSMMTESNISINPFMGHLILSLTRICCNVIGAVCVYKIKRKTLSVISAIGVGISLTSLGMYIKLHHSPSIMPIIYGVFFILFSSLGYMPLPPILMAEYCPLQIRGTVNSFVLIIKYVISFAANRLYPYSRDAITFANTVILMGIISLFGSIFLYYFIPNTKDLTLSEIEEYLKKKRPTLVSMREIKKTQYKMSISEFNIDKVRSNSTLKLSNNDSKEIPVRTRSPSLIKLPGTAPLNKSRTSRLIDDIGHENLKSDEQFSKSDERITSSSSYESDKKKTVTLTETDSKESGTTSEDKKNLTKKSSIKRRPILEGSKEDERKKYEDQNDKEKTNGDK